MNRAMMTCAVMGLMIGLCGCDVRESAKAVTEKVSKAVLERELNEAKATAAESMVKSIRGAIETYSFRHGGKYPTCLKDLVVAKDGKAPSIEGGEDRLIDPWGTEYRYERNGRKIAVVSAGPDMTFGNADDIRSDKKAEKK